MIELLEEKGLLTFKELDDRQKVVNKRLVKKFADQGMGVIALQEFKQDKYTYNEQVQIDCASRVRICRAACCRLDLALSRQDLEEGIVKWDLGRPYLIARDADDYCRHLDRATCRCAVWQQRPIPCRGYDCRQDERIWLDFEKRIINPDFDKLFEQRDGMAI
jgi:Fe-S-cluster containining protein